MSPREKLKEITSRDVGYLDGAGYTLCTKSFNARAEKIYNERDERASILSTTIPVIVKFLEEGLYVVLCGLRGKIVQSDSFLYAQICRLEWRKH